MNISCILKTQTTRIIWLYKVSCFAQNKNLPPPLYSSAIFTYLLTTRRVPGYPLSYPVGYPGNKLPDNGSPTQRVICYKLGWCTHRKVTQSQDKRVGWQHHVLECYGFGVFNGFPLWLTSTKSPFYCCLDTAYNTAEQTACIRHHSHRSTTYRSGRCKVREAMFALDQNIWQSNISLETKLRLYNTRILLAYLYGAETRSVTATLSRKIDSLDNCRDPAINACTRACSRRIKLGVFFVLVRVFIVYSCWLLRKLRTIIIR